MTSIDIISKMLVGVAFFLLAMNFMEDALKHLASRGFKLFLRRQTTSKLKAIGGGAIVSGLLQSSSILNLLVLSLAGAGVILMENSLALLLGSNLGSTLNSWVVATLGFNYDIDIVVMPVAGVAGIGMAFSNNQTKLFLWFKFIFSLAFLFIALGFIKSGMEGWVKQTDLSVFNTYPIIAFFAVGIFFTAIVQSSSVTMALALSALHANIITLYAGTALVLGAEIGTTLKLFLASAGGQAIKKKIALANFFFNVIISAIILLLLKPVNHLITVILSIREPLIALVFFQSFVNISCIVLFFPFLKFIGKMLDKRFPATEDESFYISKVPVSDTGMALEALENEVKQFINYVIAYNYESFNLSQSDLQEKKQNKKYDNKELKEKYEFIKKLHGEMHGFCLKVLNASPAKSETERLDQLISSIRNLMYATKNIRDIQRDIEQLKNSSNDVKYEIYNQYRHEISEFYSRVLKMLNKENKANSIEDLSAVFQTISTGYSDSLKRLYHENLTKKVNEIEISTLVNFNRELYTSYKSMWFGLKDFLLTASEAEQFDTMPGFIR